MCILRGCLFIFSILSVCDSAVLMHTTSGTKSLNQVSPEYIVSRKENVPSDVCLVQIDEIASNRSHYTRLNCKYMKGPMYPLNLTEDKFLRLKNSNHYIAPGKYCITKRNTAKLCPSSPFLSSNPSHFTWRKCCPQDQLVNLSSGNSCVASSILFRLSVNDDNPSFYVPNTNKIDLSCPAGYLLKKFSTDTCAAQSMTRFQLSPTTGTIQYEISTGVYLRTSEWKTVDPSSNLYCLDGVTTPASNCNNDATSFQLKQQRFVDYGEINKSGNWPIKLNHSGNVGSFPSSFHSNCGETGDDGESADRQRHNVAAILYLCVQDDMLSPEPSNENISSKTTLLAIIWLSTCPLLLGAALGNCCIIQKNVHGWILTCYLLSMCILNVLSAFVIVNVGRQQEEKGCQPVDFLIKFTYMSTLCWMSSINFGLHKTFRYTLPDPVGYRRFFISIIFSLGFPAISLTASYCAAYLFIDKTCGDLTYCILYSPITIPFYTIPMFLLVLGNFAIFLKTLYTIAKLKKEAEDVLQRQAEDHLKSFSLFAKLFLLTGCIWIVRLALFVLQIKGLYLSWYGVILEILFSIPEVAFPMIVFHHPEFIKWSWNRAPVVSNFIYKFNQLFHVPTPTTK